jgi:hypothetical protein
MASLLVCAPPSHAWQRLGIETETLARLDDTELDQIRGRFRGFYFSVMFTGWWDTMGRRRADLDVAAGLGPDANAPAVNVTVQEAGNAVPAVEAPPAVSNTDGTQVQTLAVIGGLHGARGLIQVNQVPGWGNLVHSAWWSTSR